MRPYALCLAALCAGAFMFPAGASGQESGQTLPPLLEAVELLQVDAVDSLLSAGADPNAPGPIGVTPLMLAAQSGAAEILGLLLRAGADVNRSDEDGDVALGFYLVGADEPTPIARTLLASGADPNRANQWGRTPLMFAAEQGRVDLMRTLLEAGADPRRVDRFGATAMHAAATGRTPGSIDVLVEAGISPHAADSSGATPLLYAARVDDAASARRLIERDADVAHRDVDGDHALMYAASAGSPNVARVLLDSGADPSLRGAAGATALLYAAEVGNRELARILLGAGADPNASDRFGRTPLMAAAELGDTLLIRSLTDRGAELDLRNQAGLSALDYAEEDGANDAAALLVGLGAESSPPLTEAEQATEEIASKADMAAVLLGEAELPGAVISFQGPSDHYGVEEEFTRIFEAADRVMELGESSMFSLEMVAARYSSTRMARGFVRATESLDPEDVRERLLDSRLGSNAEGAEAERTTVDSVGDIAVAYRLPIVTAATTVDVHVLLLTRGPVLVAFSASGPPGGIRTTDLAELARRVDERVLQGTRLTEDERAALEAPRARQGALQPGEAVRDGLDLAALLLTAEDLSVDAVLLAESASDPPRTRGQVNRLIQGAAGTFAVDGHMALTVQQTLTLFDDRARATDAFIESQDEFLGDSVATALAAGIGLDPGSIDVVQIEEVDSGDASVGLVAAVRSAPFTGSFGLAIVLRDRFLTTVMVLTDEQSDALALLSRLAGRIDERVLAGVRP